MRLSKTEFTRIIERRKICAHGARHVGANDERGEGEAHAVRPYGRGGSAWYAGRKRPGYK